MWSQQTSLEYLCFSPPSTHCLRSWVRTPCNCILNRWEPYWKMGRKIDLLLQANIHLLSVKSRLLTDCHSILMRTENEILNHFIARELRPHQGKTWTFWNQTCFTLKNCSWPPDPSLTTSSGWLLHHEIVSPNKSGPFFNFNYNRETFCHNY